MPISLISGQQAVSLARPLDQPSVISTPLLSYLTNYNNIKTV